MERIQILLEPQERSWLKQLANEAQTSVSDVVRDLLRERMLTRKREQLHRAAELMSAEYRTNPDLTALSAAYFAEEIGDESR